MTIIEFPDQEHDDTRAPTATLWNDDGDEVVVSAMDLKTINFWNEKGYYSTKRPLAPAVEKGSE